MSSYNFPVIMSDGFTYEKAEIESRINDPGFMRDPVVCLDDGRSYERRAWAEHMMKCRDKGEEITNPTTGAPMDPSRVVSNEELKKLIAATTKKRKIHQMYGVDILMRKNIVVSVANSVDPATTKVKIETLDGIEFTTQLIQNDGGAMPETLATFPLEKVRNAIQLMGPKHTLDFGGTTFNAKSLNNLLEKKFVKKVLDEKPTSTSLSVQAGQRTRPASGSYASIQSAGYCDVGVMSPGMMYHIASGGEEIFDLDDELEKRQMTKAL